MITPKFIKNEIVKQCYEISLHADDERIADGLTISQIEFVLSNCKVLEHYPEDTRGENCLVMGFTFEATPVHVVCGKNTAGHLFLRFIRI